MFLYETMNYETNLFELYENEMVRIRDEEQPHRQPQPETLHPQQAEKQMPKEMS